MTKFDMIHSFMQMDLKPINDRITALCKADRITVGAAFYVYSPYEFYSYKKLSEIITRALKAKDYTQYINCNVSKRDIQYYYNDFLAELEKAEKFVEEQEALPFEQTQKQLLVQKGELSH